MGYFHVENRGFQRASLLQAGEGGLVHATEDSCAVQTGHLNICCRVTKLQTTLSAASGHRRGGPSQLSRDWAEFEPRGSPTLSSTWTQVSSQGHQPPRATVLSAPKTAQPLQARKLHPCGRSVPLVITRG